MELWCGKCFASIFANINNLQDLLSNRGLEIVCSHLNIRRSSGATVLRIVAVLDDGVDVTIHNASERYPPEILKIKSIVVHGGQGCEEFAIFVQEGDHTANFLGSQVISQSMCSDLHIQRILCQMYECQERHKSCPYLDLPLLPKRVIDVGLKEANCLARLHISQADEKASYIALSYCWGGTSNVRTTTDNLPARMEGLAVATLPQTIQDAIHITRRLGIRYLWIDSLCIIQDSHADMVHEISHMGVIYKNSTLTIAAANAKKVQDGFLKELSKDKGRGLQFLLPDGHLGYIHILATWRSVSTGWPLDSRAWALQEFLLSPRLLAFGDGELRWQCQEEDLKALSASRIEYTPTLSRLPDRVFTGDFANSADVLIEQEHVWRGIMKDYSRRQITFSEDRLPALSGIASELSKIWGDEYFAGMWKRCLIQHLGWSSPCPIRQYEAAICINPRWARDHLRPQLKPVQAPSWSWVSVNREIDLIYAPIADAEVVHCKVEVVDKDSPFAYVSSGELTLRAATLNLTDLSVKYRQDLRSSVVYDSEELSDNESVFALLGRTLGDHHFGVGILLAPISDGNFKRIGQFSCPLYIAHWESVWKEARRSLITII